MFAAVQMHRQHRNQLLVIRLAIRVGDFGHFVKNVFLGVESAKNKTIALSECRGAVRGENKSWKKQV